MVILPIAIARLWYLGLKPWFERTVLDIKKELFALGFVAKGA